MDQLRVDPNGQVWYRLKEKYGAGDLFWAPAEAFHPLTAEEIAPISPNIDTAEKRIVVKTWEQTLSCYEGKTEVYFARISSGAHYDAWGNRVDTVEVTPLWREAERLTVRHGLVATAYERDHGRHARIAQFAKIYRCLFSKPNPQSLSWRSASTRSPSTQARSFFQNILWQ